MKSVRVELRPQDAFQTIDGFGANINPVNHWRNGALIPVLDHMIDDLGANLFRLDPYGFTNWVDPFDAADRSVLNADTYARVYKSNAFEDAWGMARHFNARGVEFILNVSGAVPRWMYAADGVTLADVDAYAELITSLVLWARNEEHLTFNLVNPFNETDCGLPEGPLIDPAMATDVLCRLIDRFERAGLNDIRIVAADQAWFSLDYLQAFMAEPRLRPWMHAFAVHCYSDYSFEPGRAMLAQPGAEGWHYWLGEYGDLDESGEREWDVAVISTRRLLRALNEGIQAACVWDAYDNFHGHDNCWSIYGLFRTGTLDLYTPKKRYYAAKHVYRFVPRGAVRVAADTEPTTLQVAAFRTPDGDLTVVGLNEADTALQVHLESGSGGSTARNARLFVSSQSQSCALQGSFPLGDSVVFTVPGSSVFTLTTLPVPVQEPADLVSINTGTRATTYDEIRMDHIMSRRAAGI